MRSLGSMQALAAQLPGAPAGAGAANGGTRNGNPVKPTTPSLTDPDTETDGVAPPGSETETEADRSMLKLARERSAVHLTAEKCESMCAEVHRNRKAVWQQAQERVSTLLSSTTLTTNTVQLDEFLQILNAGFKFCLIGEQFTDSQSYALRSALQLKSSEYVENFHKVRAQLERGLLRTALSLEQCL